MNFNKSIFLANIALFLKKTGKKSSELEMRAGVSRGYISRLGLENNKSIPGIDFILAASQMFGVSVEAISTIDFSQIIETDDYYLKLLSKLINSTEERRTNWNKLSLEEVNKKLSDKTNANDLVSEKKSKFKTDKMDEIFYEYNYKSAFEYKPYKVEGTEGDLYSLRIDDQNDLYISKILLTLTQGDNYIEFRGIELFIIRNKNEQIGLCYIDPDKRRPYDEILNKLYITVREASNTRALDKKTKLLLDNFINEKL